MKPGVAGATGPTVVVGPDGTRTVAAVAPVTVPPIVRGSRVGVVTDCVSTSRSQRPGAAASAGPRLTIVAAVSWYPARLAT